MTEVIELPIERSALLFLKHIRQVELRTDFSYLPRKFENHQGTITFLKFLGVREATLLDLSGVFRSSFYSRSHQQNKLNSAVQTVGLGMCRL